MSKLGTLIVAAVVAMVVGASPAAAQHGGGGHGGGGGGHEGGGHEGRGHEGRGHDGGSRNRFFFGFDGGFAPWWGGDPYYAYPYAYGYPYPYGYPYSAPATAPAAQNVWYYCPSSGAYYPYVSSCAVPWQQVIARPQ